MRPDVDTPARRLTRRECRLHGLLADLAARGDAVAVAGCRRELRGLSALRSRVADGEARLAALEIDEAAAA